MKSGIQFKDGTTILAHDNLISFVNNTDSRIFHRPYSDIEFGIYETLKHNPKLFSIQDESFIELFDDIVETGFASYTDARHNNFDVIRKNNPQILHALVMLTNACNMDCKYCYTEANQHTDDEREISGKEWAHIFDTIKISGRYVTQNVSLTGGEPTIHPDITDIIKSLSGRYKIEISSNGLVIKNHLLKALKDCDGLHLVNISMDSYRDKDDELMRGRGTFRPRMKNIQKLHSSGIPLSLGVVVNSVTVKTLEQTTRVFLERFPNSFIKYIPITKMGAAKSLSEEIFMSQDDVKRYIDSALKMRNIYGSRIQTDPTSTNTKALVKWSGRCSHMKYESEQPIITNINSLIVSEKCNAAYGVVSLSSSGRLRPCLRADSFFESLFRDAPEDILMPHIENLDLNSIRKLRFWQYVKEQGKDFNPLMTCALKSAIDRRGYEHK